MTPLFHHFFHEFLHLSQEILPYFILSIFLGAFLDSRLDSSRLMHWFRQKSDSVVMACLFGMILPLCSCTSMPLAQALKAKGTRMGVIVALLMINPFSWLYSLTLAYSLLGLPFVFGHLIFSFFSAIFLGHLFNYLQARRVPGFHAPLSSSTTQACHNPAHEHYHQHEHDVIVEETPHTHQHFFWPSVFRISKTLGPYLLFALLIASLVMTFLPETEMMTYLSGSSSLSYLVAILIGVPFHACAGEEVPILFSLLKLGMPTGPAFTFMVTSVGTGIPTMILAKKVLGFRPMILYMGLFLGLALIGGFIFQVFVPVF